MEDWNNGLGNQNNGNGSVNTEGTQPSYEPQTVENVEMPVYQPGTENVEQTDSSYERPASFTPSEPTNDGNQNTWNAAPQAEQNTWNAAPQAEQNTWNAAPQAEQNTWNAAPQAEQNTWNAAPQADQNTYNAAPDVNQGMYSAPTMDNGTYQNAPQNNAYTAPTYYAEDTVTPPVSGTLGLVGMILGICSLVLPVCCCGSGWLSGAAAIAGIICSTIAMKKGSNPGKAKAGLICSIIAIVISLALIIIGFVIGFSSSYQDILNSIQNSY